MPQPQLNQNVSPTQKAAMVLVAMGVENAAQIMKNLSDDEVEKITLEIARLQNIPAEMISEVLEEYYTMMLENNIGVQGGMDFAKTALKGAMGDKKADDVFKRVEQKTEVSAFYLLQSVDDKQLLNFLQNEHPQTAALILANLQTNQAANLLSELPQENQTEIAYRLATMEKTSPELIADIEAVLKDQIGAVFGSNLSNTGGAEAVAEILNSASRSAEKNIMDTLKKRNEDLAEEITSHMFVFEDILTLTDEAVQKVVKEVDSKTLALALKSISDELKEKIFNNLSERGAEMLKDELEYLKNVRLKDVEAAQKQLVDAVRKLEESGDIIIIRGEEEQIIE